MQAQAPSNTPARTRSLVALLDGPYGDVRGPREPEPCGSVTLDAADAPRAETAEARGDPAPGGRGCHAGAAGGVAASAGHAVSRAPVDTPSARRWWRRP